MFLLLIYCVPCMSLITHISVGYQFHARKFIDIAVFTLTLTNFQVWNNSDARLAGLDMGESYFKNLNQTKFVVKSSDSHQ